jgi:hypothetical protein
MAPVGHTSAHVAHSMQSAEEIWNGVLTARSIPRWVRLMAPTPTISRQARTHSPHKMQSLASSVT